MLVIIIAALGAAGLLVFLLVQMRTNRWLHRRVEDLELKVQHIEAEHEVDNILAEIHHYPRTVRRRLRLVRGGMMGLLLLTGVYGRQILTWVQARPMLAAGIILAGIGAATAIALPFTMSPTPRHDRTPVAAPPQSTAAAPPSVRPPSRRSIQAPTRGPTPTTSPPPPPTPSAVPADDPDRPSEPDPPRTDSPSGGGDGGGGDGGAQTPSSPPATDRPPESGGDREGCLDILVVAVCIG